MDKFSYSIGMSLGQTMIGSGVKELDFDSFLSGVKVIFTGETPAISLDEGNKILNEYFSKAKKEATAKLNEERTTNLKVSKEYLDQHKNLDGVQETKSGLQYKVISEQKADTKSPTSHSRVKCHYEGRLIDGTVFDSSYKRGVPATFSLEQVIPGWTEGLQLMTVGDKYEFTIPPQLGYGEVGVPGHIPGNSVLIFTVELLEIL